MVDFKLRFRASEISLIVPFYVLKLVIVVFFPVVEDFDQFRVDVGNLEHDSPFQPFQGGRKGGLVG